jgi:hypothetical protein
MNRAERRAREMLARKTHAHLQRQTEIEMNRLRREFAVACASIVATETAVTGAYDIQCHMRVLRALEVPLSRLYGMYRGDPDAALTTLVVGCARRAYMLGFRQTLDDMRRHVPASVVREVREGVNDRQNGIDRGRPAF